MKKAITILAVLIVLASAVFAAETHQLKVKADVVEVLPAFNLSIGSAAAENTNANVNNKYGVENPSPAYNANATNEKAKELSFDLDESGSFSVEAQVINNVKTNKTFTIEFKGGVFTVDRNTISGKYSPSQITIQNGSADDAVKEYGTASASTENTSKTADTSTTAVAKTTVTFSGKTATDQFTVATATYNYPGDDSIDPNTSSKRWYYADIYMIVTEGTV